MFIRCSIEEKVSFGAFFFDFVRFKGGTRHFEALIETGNIPIC